MIFDARDIRPDSFPEFSKSFQTNLKQINEFPRIFDLLEKRINVLDVSKFFLETKTRKVIRIFLKIPEMF